MIQFNVFPGGVKRAVTFSYDDGCPEDARIVQLLNKYGVKGTFHISSGPYGHIGELTIGKLTDEKAAKIRETYKGHEISCHTANHGHLEKMPAGSIVREIMEDRITLERIAGYPVKGMSYPIGTYSERAKKVLSDCGIVYSRTVKETGRFEMPEDFLEWHPTCHQNNAPEVCRRFMNNIDDRGEDLLLYIWGHGFELDSEEKWAELEECVAMISHNKLIWYATNMEICEYVNAQRRLVISADERIIKNPTSIDLWVEAGLKKVCIPAGETVTVEHGGSANS